MPEQKHIFIDANIFLDFYRYSDDDLQEIGKLKILIDQGQVVLYLPDQIIFEFERNRDGVVSESYKKFSDIKLDQQFPRMCHSYDEYKEIRSAIKAFKEAKSNLENKLNEDINNNSLTADTIVREIFDKAQKIKVSEDIINKAVIRYQRGNPPKKNDNSYGDAINWETLLENVPNNVDFVLISDDKDFKSPNSQFNSFLDKEWKISKQSKILYYNRLSLFFKENYPDIQLKEEEEKDILINELSYSMNFANTHNTIFKLSKFSEFSPYHIRKLVDIAISNSQIYWIAEDEDINNFFLDLVRGKEDLLDSETYNTFAQYFIKQEEDEASSVESENINDVPF